MSRDVLTILSPTRLRWVEPKVPSRKSQQVTDGLGRTSSGCWVSGIGREGSLRGVHGGLDGGVDLGGELGCTGSFEHVEEALPGQPDEQTPAPLSRAPGRW
jgi:hypothetical protein